MNILNRKELLITYDLNQLNRLRDALSQAGIDYQLRTKDLASPSIFEAGSRSRTGSRRMAVRMRRDSNRQVLPRVRRKEARASARKRLEVRLRRHRHG